jgi:hypothetical protein
VLVLAVLEFLAAPAEQLEGHAGQPAV